MSDFIHAREQLKAGDLVIVDCSHQCNIRLMDDANFGRYRRGGRDRIRQSTMTGTSDEERSRRDLEPATRLVRQRPARAGR